MSRWLFPALLTALVVALVEAMSFTAGRVLEDRRVLYAADALPDYADYLARRRQSASSRTYSLPSITLVSLPSAMRVPTPVGV